MSEYQYYEFQSVDRMLMEKEIKTLRKYSSRAIITSSRFVNEYNYGDFKGDVIKWMESYFDSFLHFANWGTRELIFRFPRAAVDIDLIKKYCPGECAECWITDTHALVRYCVEDFEGEEWWKNEDGSLSDFLVLRSNILEDDDYRMLYLGWLLGVQYGIVDDGETEPPLPQGLKSLSNGLKLFARFFGLNDELIKTAAKNSTEEIRPIYDDDIEPCVAGLNNGEKLMWLCRLALHNDKNLGAMFRREILPDSGIEIFCESPPRTAGELQ